MFRVESQGAVDVVSIAGPLNLENAPSFVETIERGLPGGQPMVVVDMQEVPLLDSAGLEALVDKHQSTQLQGGSIKLASLSQLCQEILRITKIDEKIETYPDVKTAVGSFVK